MIAQSTQRLRTAPLFALAPVTAIHLGAQLAQAKLLAAVTQTALMPMLALWVFVATRAPRSRTTKLALLALGFSWLGDTAPKLVPQQATFLTMLGFFLVAQVLMVCALLPHRARSVLRGSPTTSRILLGLAVAVGLAALLGLGRHGPMAASVVCYASSIIAMALLATALGRLGVIGGGLFIVSDSLIALRTFAGLELPAAGFWVMLTYVAAQLCLAMGVVRLAAEDPLRLGHPQAAPGIAPAP